MADLSNTDLSHTDLGQSALNGANLRGANLTSADLSDATFTAVELLNSENKPTGRFWSANLTAADLTDAILWRAEMSTTNLHGAYLDGTDFSGAGPHASQIRPRRFGRRRPGRRQAA